MVPRYALRSAIRREHGIRSGFSLVELLVVIAILGLLVGLLLPAVQGVRESSRKTTCANNIRQCAFAVLGYESGRRRFPAGFDHAPAEPELPEGTLHAWSSFVLPFLEEGGVAAKMDYSKLWSDPNGNSEVAKGNLAIFRCPTAMLSYVGKADIGGISGAWMPSLEIPGADTSLANGLLIPITHTGQYVRASAATDGLSQTLLLAEATDRGPAPGEPSGENDPIGRWAVYNCFAQTEEFINTWKSDIRSLHPSGAHAAFGDGRVVFLIENMEPTVLSAICSRNGGESVVGLQ